MTVRTINIAKEFTDFPAGRSSKNDPYSGEAFRDKYLIPALEQDQIIEIDFDGVFACPPGFLEEAFGGVIRHYSHDVNYCTARIRFKPASKTKYQNYIDVANKFMQDAIERIEGC